MDPWVAITLIFGGFLLFMMATMPVPFAFMLMNVVGLLLLWGGTRGFELLTSSMAGALATAQVSCIALFMLMGEVLFRSGLAGRLMDTVDKLAGRLPGRLSFIAVITGTIFATLTGSSIGSTALLGRLLYPEMKKRNYHTDMILGPILAGGTLAPMIPPSGLAVLMAILGEFSIGKMLIAIIVPGLLMATVFAVYILVRCFLQPQLAPPYDAPHYSAVEKLTSVGKNIVPLAFCIFMVTGLIIFGIATPTEAAAAGAFGAFILALAYRKLNWGITKDSLRSTASIVGMIFTIIISADAFSQMCVFTGATRLLTQIAISAPVHPLVVFAFMQLVGVLLGTVLSPIPVMMITMPLFMPVVHSLGFDPVWFGVIYLINMEIAPLSPPFGVSLFVAKGVAGGDVSVQGTFKAAMPFLYCDIVTIALLTAFPAIALWLPGLMRGG